MNQDSTPSVAATVGLSRKIGAAVAAFAALGAGTAGAQQVVYVDDDAPAGGDGQTWETALNSIAEAIDVLSGTTFQGNPGVIRVAEGLYHVTDPTHPHVDSLVLQSGMSLVGGFRGLSPGGSAHDRNPRLFRTVLDAAHPGPPEVASVGVHVPAFETVVIDGIHFQGFGIDHILGEIYAFITVRDCSFVNTSRNAYCVSLQNRGGRLIMEQCDMSQARGGRPPINTSGCLLVLLRDCIFDSLQDSPLQVRVLDATVADIQGCSFRSNPGACIDLQGCAFVSLRDVEVRDCGSPSSLTPVRVRSSLLVDIDGCVFDGNSGRDFGGALHVDASVRSHISNTRFVANTTPDNGGALHIAPSEASPLTLSNCLFAQNHAGGRGSAVFSWVRLDARNCTFAHNVADASGAAIEQEWGVLEPTIRDSVVWANGAAGVQVQVQPYLPALVTDSILPSGPLGAGCVAADPLFLAPGDYRLSPASPAINLGFNPAFDPLNDQLDLAGNPRLSGGFVDAGCYEATIAPGCGPADLALTAVRGQSGYRIPDGTVGTNDFFVYLEAYHRGDAAADLTSTGLPGTPGYGVPNGLVTSEDFFYYLVLYQQGC